LHERLNKIESKIDFEKFGIIDYPTLCQQYLERGYFKKTEKKKFHRIQILSHFALLRYGVNIKLAITKKGEIAKRKSRFNKYFEIK
jgi:hypothetical protein